MRNEEKETRKLRKEQSFDNEKGREGSEKKMGVRRKCTERRETGGSESRVGPVVERRKKEKGKK